MTIMSPISTDKDYNFFKRLAVNATTFATTADMLIPIQVESITFQNEGTGSQAIEYSFNGQTVHGDLTVGTNSASLTFLNRPICKIWWRVKSGTSGPVNVRVEAWAIR